MSDVVVDSESMIKLWHEVVVTLNNRHLPFPLKNKDSFSSNVPQGIVVLAFLEK